ncbi:MAG TPA: hypothetical protein VFW29_03975, partial [Solirubrobacteraceae bacterium]|nr:hypothetical protein [Solirubrobacteraceae bacterium]
MLLAVAGHGARQPAAAQSAFTFGTTTVGKTTASFAANRKQVNRYALPAAGAVTSMSIYLAPTATAGNQVMEGVVYADSQNVPASLRGVSSPLTFSSSSPAGWYTLSFPSPLKLAAGSYWIGVITGTTAKVAGYRYSKASASRDSNANKYTSGPSNPFGTPSSDAQQMSLYATYVAVPANTVAPSISGSAQQGQTLTTTNGSWSGEPTSYSYSWQRCDSSGA